MGIRIFIALSLLSFLLGCKKETKPTYLLREGLYSIILYPDEGLSPHTNPKRNYYFIEKNAFHLAYSYGKGDDTICYERMAGNLIPSMDSIYIPSLQISQGFFKVCASENEKYGGDSFVFYPSKITLNEGTLCPTLNGRYRIQYPNEWYKSLEYGRFEMGVIWLK
ncbi:MAG: hypothetical protein CFE21_02175 [Bacteroidetes bacterium B1(2017)]|nr:MAG: hypothetical protein CFE21_02175 [Bacteroidetes bacterium B1(2017)]